MFLKCWQRFWLSRSKTAHYCQIPLKTAPKQSILPNLENNIDEQKRLSYKVPNNGAQ
jgi:hypothetical protein